ncbi:flagellar biosynthesis protein FliQ [Haloimpatiens lingqiaonensis]|uniref:flagellar biosynthesis protein FliQ n=1 Tax=Haloimpatiens lingqiaonensis TaxID=1380675 RepID=UPI0010FE40E4|nr:flagellar biosynthesis protein FliQ [Haloimpatiens lingqiaonensis]
MTESMVISVMKDAISTALTLSAPILITGILVGLFVSILQATTQIQEQTLTFVPKLIAVAVVGLITAPWMIHVMNGFTRRIFDMIANLIQ